MRETVEITVRGQPLTVVIRPITPAALVKAGVSDMPTLFASGGGGGDVQAAIRFMHAIIVAGTVAVRDSAGRTYRLTMDPSPEPDTLTPEELDEPGLADPMTNTQTLFRRILALSGMEELFRPKGAESGEGDAVDGDGPSATRPGEALPGGPLDHSA